jgi:hypothetical protein
VPGSGAAVVVTTAVVVGAAVVGTVLVVGVEVGRGDVDAGKTIDVFEGGAQAKNKKARTAQRCLMIRRSPGVGWPESSPHSDIRFFQLSR